MFPDMRMDGESGLASGRIQRERKRSYKDFMQDLDDTELRVEEDQEYNTKTHKVGHSNGCLVVIWLGSRRKLRLYIF